MQTDPVFSVAVHSSEMALIAAFTSPVEACRYAALICEPDSQPILRRIADGGQMRFHPGLSSSIVLRWAEAHESDHGLPAMRPGA